MRITPDHLAHGYELMRLERYDLALQEVQRALEQDPNAAAPHICGAWVLRRQGKLHEAEQAARAALAAEPQSPAAHHVLACVLWSAGRLREAEAAFKAALINPDADQALYLTNYARLLAATSRHAEALATAERALALAPWMSIAHEVHGIALRGLGREAAAAVAYREALRLDPRNFEAHNNLGVLELHAGRGAVALDCFREALRLKPGDRTARANLVRALKARNWLYGQVLALALRSGNPRFTRFVRWSIAAYFVLLFLFAALSDYNPIFDIIGRTFASGFLLFFLWLLARFVWNWIVDPIFNTLLLFDPLGRQILEHDTADGAVTLGLLLTLLCLLGAGIAGALFGADHPATTILLGWGGASAVGMLLSKGVRGLDGVGRYVVWVGFALMLLGGYILTVGLVLGDPPTIGLAAVAINTGLVIFLVALAVGRSRGRRRR